MNKLQSLKFILISFCVISGGLSIYFIVDAVVRKPKSKIKIDHIRSPRPSYEPDEEMYDNNIPNEIYQQIQDYKRYADSTGQPIRRGLLDSMNYLEQMYLQQQK